MEQADLFHRFGAALAIGFLVGLQREFAHGGRGREIIAGERTFALMGLIGCTAALIADLLSLPWAFAGIFVALVGLIGVTYFATAWQQGQIGLTSEMAAVVVVLAGGLCYWGHLALAAGIGTAFLL